MELLFMQGNSKNFLQVDKLLYSHQKALNELIALGLIPQRLFRILYPVRIVDVFGKQRFSSNIEESQWFVERGIHEAKLSSIDDLAEYLGLDHQFIKKMLAFLKQINHLEIDNGKLSLTELGIRSVQEQICYQEQETNFRLFFDAFGNYPLLQEHMRIKHLDEIPENIPFHPPLPIFPEWDSKSLSDLHHRSDRYRYGLMDEVSQIGHSQVDKIIYMPVYIIERKVRRTDTAGVPNYLAFSSIPGYRDFELERIVNEVPEVLNWLSLLKRESPEEAIRKRMQGLNIEKGSFEIVLESVLGIEVIVNGNAISTAKKNTNLDQSNRLTINSIGKYLLATDWCIWVTSNDESIRRRAAVQQTLEWLHNSVAPPQRGDIEKFIIEINNRLSVKSPITRNELMTEAIKEGLFTAIDRLEAELSN